MPMNGFRRKVLDSTEGHLGVCSTHGVTCAICSKIQDFEKPFTAAHWARKFARMSGWHYIQKWGWICGGCRSSIPGELSQHHAAMERQPWRKSRELKRLQVEIKLK